MIHCSNFRQVPVNLSPVVLNGWTLCLTSSEKQLWYRTYNEQIDLKGATALGTTYPALCSSPRSSWGRSSRLVMGQLCSNEDYTLRYIYTSGKVEEEKGLASTHFTIIVHTAWHTFFLFPSNTNAVQAQNRFPPLIGFKRSWRRRADIEREMV